MTIEWFNFWNSENANKLDNLFETNFDVARSILYQINAKKSDILIEFGCGTGKLLSFMEKSVTTSIGLDFSKKRTSLSNTKRTEFINVDSFNCNLKSNVFDKVFCFSLLNFLTLDEAITTIEEMIRITKNDGIILIGDILKEEFEKMFYFKIKNENIKCPSLSFYKEKVLHKIIENINKNTEIIIYDTKINNYKNNDLSFNILIHKQ